MVPSWNMMLIFSGANLLTYRSYFHYMVFVHILKPPSWAIQSFHIPLLAFTVDLGKRASSRHVTASMLCCFGVSIAQQQQEKSISLEFHNTPTFYHLTLQTDSNSTSRGIVEIWSELTSGHRQNDVRIFPKMTSGLVLPENSGAGPRLFTFPFGLLNFHQNGPLISAHSVLGFPYPVPANRSTFLSQTSFKSL